MTEPKLTIDPTEPIGIHHAHFQIGYRRVEHPDEGQYELRNQDALEPYDDEVYDEYPCWVCDAVTSPIHDPETGDIVGSNCPACNAADR